MAKCSVQMSDTDKFMDKFDPSQSNREKRKKLRTLPSTYDNGNKRVEKLVTTKLLQYHIANLQINHFLKSRKAGIMYSDKGILLHDGADVCDCLSNHCPGCFFPCPKCRSPKCGLECR